MHKKENFRKKHRENGNRVVLKLKLSNPKHTQPNKKVGDDALKNFILDERERLRESNLSPEENQKLRIKRAQEREQEREHERKIKENEKRDRREAQDALDAECAPAKYYAEEMVKQGRKKGTPECMPGIALAQALQANVE